MKRVVVLALAGFAWSFAAFPLEAQDGKKQWNPPFYAFCVGKGIPGTKPPSMEDEGKLLVELGFDGGGWELWLGGQLDRNLAILDALHLKAYLLYTSVNLKNEKDPYDRRVATAIGKLKGRPVTINVLLVGLPPGDPKGMEIAQRVLRELGDFAAKAGLRISIYNHAGNWTESVRFALSVVKKVDHPNVGANFNLCHWLKAEGREDHLALIRDNASRIFAVTICGATVASNAWVNGLIQPLDRGDFDNQQLLLAFRNAGYRGPVGLHCYSIPGDPREHLARSMAAWKRYAAVLNREP